MHIRCFPVMFLGHPIQRKLIQVPLFYLKITINNNKIITINNCSIMTYKVFSLLSISTAPFYILKNRKGKAPDFQMYRVLLYQTILFKTSEQTHIYMLKVYSNSKVNGLSSLPSPPLILTLEDRYKAGESTRFVMFVMFAG